MNYDPEKPLGKISQTDTTPPLKYPVTRVRYLTPSEFRAWKKGMAQEAERIREGA